MSQDAIAGKLNQSGILLPAEYKASMGSKYQTSFKVKVKSGWTSVAVQSETRLFDNQDIPPLKQTLTDVENEYQKGIILKALDDEKTIIGSVRAFCDNETVYIG